MGSRTKKKTPTMPTDDDLFGAQVQPPSPSNLYLPPGTETPTPDYSAKLKVLMSQYADAVRARSDRADFAAATHLRDDLERLYTVQITNLERMLSEGATGSRVDRAISLAYRMLQGLKRAAPKA